MRSVALSFYEKMLAHLPRDKPSRERADTYLKLVDIYLSLSEDEAARAQINAYFEELEQLGLLNASSYQTIAIQARRYGRAELTIEVLERGVAHSEPNINLVETLAESYAQRGELGQVEAIMKAYVERVDEGERGEALKQVAGLGEAAQ